MLQSISIENFKSFRQATLPLAPLTLLIGANASGKSNAIEAMQLLSWLATGRRLGDILVAMRGASPLPKDSPERKMAMTTGILRGSPWL